MRAEDMVFQHGRMPEAQMNVLPLVTAPRLFEVAQRDGTVD